MKMSGERKLKIYGTRGSAAAPFLNRMRYGGNTSCTAVWFLPEAHIVVFDAGTGILGLAEEICRFATAGKDAGEERPVHVHLFLGHYHFDHIIGLPMFLSQVQNCCASVEIYCPSFEANVPLGLPAELMPREDGKPEELIRQLGEPGWPVRLDELCPKAVFHTVQAGDQICIKMVEELRSGAEDAEKLCSGEQSDACEEWIISAYPGNHPGGSILYALSNGESKIGYGLDHELTDLPNTYSIKDGSADGLPAGSSASSASSIPAGPSRLPLRDAGFAQMAENCKVLVFDGAYNENDYMKGYGHSTWERGAKAAEMLGVETLGIAHHSFSYTDEFLDGEAARARTVSDRVVFLQEGMEFFF